MPRAILRTTDQLVNLFVPFESSFHAQAKYGNKTEKCSIFNIFFFSVGTSRMIKNPPQR